ncbi:MAG TPA: hypothetical protein VN610_00445 [Bryobacteraceae bacterium]|nr:hypothetical protein [Bryobacteraceae bacterium]
MRKILLVEDSSEDELLLREMIADLAEVDPRGGQIEMMPCGDLALAVDLLSEDSFDSILLNLSLPDSPTLLDSFLTVSAKAPETPIVVLLDESDELLASSLLRDGAQDVLAKQELDAPALARAVGFAIERQRRVNAVSVTPLTDRFTGLWNNEAFRVLAEHDLRVARQMHLPLAVIVTELEGEDGDLECLEFADQLCKKFPEAATLARLTGREFALTHFGDIPDTSVRTGVAAFHPDEQRNLDDLLADARSALGTKPAIVAI